MLLIFSGAPAIALFTRHKLTRVRTGLKLTQVVFTRHFSKLTRVQPGLVVFTRQTNPGSTRVKTNPGCVYTTQTNPGSNRLKLTQVVFTRHFSKLTRVETGLVVFTRQTNPGRTRVSNVYTTETNPG